MYLTSVQQVRHTIGRVVPSFALTKGAADERLTTLVKLTPTGNLVAGAVTRTAIGFVVNPLTVVKVRYEVRARRDATWILSRSWAVLCLAQMGWSATGRNGEC